MAGAWFGLAPTSIAYCASKPRLEATTPNIAASRHRQRPCPPSVTPCDYLPQGSWTGKGHRSHGVNVACPSWRLIEILFGVLISGQREQPEHTGQATDKESKNARVWSSNPPPGTLESQPNPRRCCKQGAGVNVDAGRLPRCRDGPAVAHERVPVMRVLLSVCWDVKGGCSRWCWVVGARRVIDALIEPLFTSVLGKRGRLIRRRRTATRNFRLSQGIIDVR
jgi:hypothetical protein